MALPEPSPGQTLTPATISRAWFGCTPESPFQFGLWLEFTFGEGRTHQTCPITMCLAPGIKWGPSEKVSTAARAFLEIARFLYKHKVTSVDALVGRRAELELYGGNCLRAFRVLPKDPVIAEASPASPLS